MEESINDDQVPGRKGRREKRHYRKYSDSRNILDTNTLASVPVDDTVPKNVAVSRPEPSKTMVRNQTFTGHPFHATSNDNDSDSEEIPEDIPLNNVKKIENGSSENRKFNEVGVADKTKQSSSENKTLFPSSSLTRKSISLTTAKLKSDNIEDTKKCNYRRPWQYKENEVLKNVVKENTVTTQNDLNVTDEDSTEQFSDFIDTDVVNVTLSEEFAQNGPHKTMDRSSERETSFCDTGQAGVLPTNDTQNGSGVIMANHASTQTYLILDRQMPNQSCVEILSSTPYFDSENNNVCSAITQMLCTDAVEVSTQTYSESDAEIKAADQSNLEQSITNGTDTQTIGSTNAKSKHRSGVIPKVLGLPAPGIVTHREEQLKGFHELIDAVQDIETLPQTNEDIVSQSNVSTVTTANVIALLPETCSDVEVFGDFFVSSTSNGLRKTAIDTDNVIDTLKFQGAGRMCKIRKEDNLVAVLVADGKSYIAIVNVEGRMSFAYCLVLEQTTYSDISHIDTYFDKDPADSKYDLKTRHVFALSYSGRNASCQAWTDFIDLVKGTYLKQGYRKFQCPEYETELHKGMSGISFKDVSGIYGMASDRFGYLFIACSYHLVYVHVYKKNIIWKYQFRKSPSDVSCCGCLVAVSVKDEERIELRNREGTLLYSNILDKDLSLQPHRISVNKDRLFLKVFNQTTWEAVILPCDIKKYSTDKSD